jgi:hypothetical protein
VQRFQPDEVVSALTASEEEEEESKVGSLVNREQKKDTPYHPAKSYQLQIKCARNNIVFFRWY